MAGPLRRDSSYGHHFRAAIETTSDGFWMLDREGRILDVNKAYVERSGYRREDILSMRIADLEADEGPEDAAAHIEKVVRNGSDCFESRHRAKNGTIWPVEVTTSYWPEHDRFFSFIRDIQRRKRSEALLRTRFRLIESASEHEIDELLRTALDEAELLTGSNIGFFHFVHEDQETILLQTWSTNTLAHMCSAKGKGLHYPVSAAGVWVDCLRTRRPVIHNDYASLHGKKGLPEGHAPILRELTVPILRGDQVLAIIGVGNKASDYRGEDIEIVLEIATLLTDAVLHHRAEVDLRSSEASLREAQVLAHLGNWEWDLRVDGLSWSHEVFRIFGRDPDHFQPSLEAFEDALHPDDRTRVIESRRTLLAGQSTDWLDYRIVLPDGSTKWVQDRAREVVEPDGRVVKIVGTVQDITESRRTEVALRESEARLRKAQSLAHVGDWTFEVDSGALYWSNELHNIFGIPPSGAPISVDEMMAKVHPDDRARLRREIEAGRSERTDYRIVHDGQIRHIHEEIELIEDGKGVVTRFRGTAQDITERVQTAERLRRSDEAVKNLLDQVDECFLVLDPELRVLSANRAAARLTNLPVEALVGKPLQSLPPPVATACDPVELSGVLASWRPLTTTQALGVDGHDRVLETAVVPLRGGENESDRLIVSINDVTVRHLLEEERLKGQKLESIGTLAGGIAHDFNNLLQSVMGHVSLARLFLESPDRTPKARAMLDKAEEALVRSVDLTRQLLTFARGGRPIRENIALQEVVEEAARFALSGTRSDVRFDADPDLWSVSADPAQIAQAVRNIVMNADQAMPFGGTVTFTSRNVSNDLPEALEPGRYVSIEISDEGIGIPETHLDKVFDPYFTTKQRGSGLGLATAYSIVKNHDGHLTVQSTAGRGSTLRILLPAEDEAPAKRDATRIPEEVVPRRVLVMDDEEAVRAATGELLAALGHDCELADKGETALEVYREAGAEGRPFDIVILDLTVPGGMGGLETFARLLEIDPDIKAIVSSGYSDDGSLADYRKRGFAAFLPKPYRIGDLQAALTEVLEVTEVEDPEA